MKLTYRIWQYNFYSLHRNHHALFLLITCEMTIPWIRNPSLQCRGHGSSLPSLGQHLILTKIKELSLKYSIWKYPRLSIKYLIINWLIYIVSYNWSHLSWRRQTEQIRRCINPIHLNLNTFSDKENKIAQLEEILKDVHQ